MKSYRLAWFPEVREVFVYEERAVVIVEGAFAAHEKLDFLDPGRVVDESLKGFATFVNLLEVQSGITVSVVMGVDVSEPLAGF